MEATPAPEAPPETGNGAGIDLKITVRDRDGKIVNSLCKDGDIYLYNWAVFVASLLKYGFVGSVSKQYYGIRKSDGAQLGFATNNTIATGYQNGSNWRWGNGGRICLGASSQAATIRDFDLAAPVKEIVASVPILQQDGNTLKVIVSGTASFTSETTLSECALAVCLPWNQSDDPTINRVIITRDTFTAVTVPAGGTITLQFELWFNAMPTS
jgi:hypothetical protein